MTPRGDGPGVDAACADDVAAMVRLLDDLFSQEREFAPDARRQRDGLRALVAAPERGCVLVVRDGAEVVGMVTLQYLVSTALGGPVALLEDLVVDPGRRGEGLGSRLLEAALAEARRRGCLRVTLLTDRDNEHARRLYVRHGFRASPMQPLRCPLAPDVSGADHR